MLLVSCQGLTDTALYSYFSHKNTEVLETGQLLCTDGKWPSQDSVVLLQDFCFPLIVKVPGRGHALPASQHLRAEEEQGPGAAGPGPGSLVSGLQAFPFKRPKLERGEDDSFFCDQRES